MRNLNPDALAKIAQHYGNEPIAIIDVQWIKGSSTISYADRDLAGIKGKILEVSNLDAVVNIFKNSSSQEISVTLDDTTGEIKTIMDTNDIHKSNVWVYQYFEGLNQDDRFLLFDGKINSPIVWSEGSRTVSFTILAQLEDVEVGFAPEEGQFPEMPQDLIGKPWPMVFGTVAHSKTVKLTPELKGITADGVGLPDFTLQDRLVALQQIYTYSKRALLVPEQHSSHYSQFLQVQETLAQQNSTVKQNIRIFGGEKFPRGNITIQVGSVLLDGHFGSGSSNVFYITGGSGARAQHPSDREYCWGGTGPTTGFGRRYGTCAVGDKIKTRPYAVGYQVTSRGGANKFFIPTGEVIGDSAGYIYARPGSTVTLYSNEPQSYVVSITPGEVLRVVAWAQKDGQRFVQDIPTNWYTVSVETFGNVSATIVTISDSLSKKADMGFEDDIFVTFKSTIGPNTVEILEYLVALYTDFTVDSNSFGEVQERLENYPSHFALYDRPNILSLLQSIAWQANCAIYLKNGVFYLIYLPAVPVADDTIAPQDVLIETLSLEHTPTEDIVTKMKCKWTASGIQEEEFRTVLRHNVAKYGTQEKEYDYFIYDYVDAVIKSATFWLIRNANTWKFLRFETPLTKLALETFDFVTIDAPGIAANVPFVATIEEASYNSENNTLIFECWCPIKAGEMAPYEFAHPANVETWQTFPTDYEIQQGFDGGVGPGKDASADSPLFEYIKTQWAAVGSTGFDKEENEYEEEDPYDQKKSEEEDRRKEDKGNPKPTTGGDVHPGEKIIRPGETMEEPNPGPDSPDTPGAGLPEPDGYGGPNSGFPENPPSGPDDGTGDPGSGSPAQDALNDLPSCDDSEFANCPKVKVTWLVGVDKVSQPQGGGPCIQTRVPPDRGVCTATGGFQVETIVFNTNAEAQAFAEAVTAKITKAGLTGDTIPYFANFIAGVDDCQDTGKSDGATGYCNNNPDGYGSGAFLDGVPSFGYGD